jgi:hypothetical protein
MKERAQELKRPRCGPRSEAAARHGSRG